MCGQIHPDKVRRLNRVLIETGCKIVLSSAWRYIVHRDEMSLMGMEWLLRSHGVIADRLVGITRPDTMMPKTFNGKREEWPVENERGLQIAEYCRLEGVRRYAVIDDLDLGITAAGHPFVQTDGKVGMTNDDAARLVQLLS